MNFKIGDIVTGKQDNGYHITTDKAIMKVVAKSDLNDEVTVEVIKHNEYPGGVGEKYNIESTAVTLFKEPNNEIIIYQKDNKVIAEHKEKKLQAIARCHPQDKFNFMIGAKLALERLDEILKQALNPPLYYVKFTDGDEYGYLNIHTKLSFTVISNKEEKCLYKTKFTLEQIKEINPNYIPFAIKVEEDK